MSSLEKYLFSSVAHFFNWIVYFSGIELQELLVYFEINSLSVASFAIIFSHSEGCLVPLLIVSFIVQKFLVQLGPICLFFLLFPLLWEVGHGGSCFSLSTS